jgi:hypothetical protein
MSTLFPMVLRHESEISFTKPLSVSRYVDRWPWFHEIAGRFLLVEGTVVPSGAPNVFICYVDVGSCYQNGPIHKPLAYFPCQFVTTHTTENGESGTLLDKRSVTIRYGPCAQPTITCGDTLCRHRPCVCTVLNVCRTGFA